MKLADYLEHLNYATKEDPDQAEWYGKLYREVEKGIHLFNAASQQRKSDLLREFENRIRTEEIKAWYSSPDGDTLFQGTSISSLTIPCELAAPLDISDVCELEAALATWYVALHEKHAETVRGAVLEDVSKWIEEGLYYGVVISSKLITQAFGLTAPHGDVVLQVGDHLVDPHEIISYPQDVRERYFEEVGKRIDCYGDMELTREEMESSLILADISKPRIERYESQIMLAPVRCNEIAAAMSRRITKLIEEESRGSIVPRSVEVVIYDTDTPYTYHHLLGCNGNPLAPVLPGLTVMGASGTIDAFRWLYTYRVSLVAQKIQKGSLYSQAHQRFIPFVYFGVLVPRDAEILLDMNNLGKLRYRGNICPQMEFCYLLPTLERYLDGGVAADLADLAQRIV